MNTDYRQTRNGAGGKQLLAQRRVKNKGVLRLQGTRSCCQRIGREAKRLSDVPHRGSKFNELLTQGSLDSSPVGFLSSNRPAASDTGATMSQALGCSENHWAGAVFNSHWQADALTDSG